MIDIALYFLYEVAKRSPRNFYLVALYNQIKNAGGIIDLKQVDLLNVSFDETLVLEEKNPQKIEIQGDYRFLYLYLKAFRKFPKLQGNDYFGISFCREKDSTHIPCNTIIQGGNGTGKTSVFGAMEYLFTGNMSAAYKHGYMDDEKLDDYLPYAGCKMGDLSVIVASKDRRFQTGEGGKKQQGLTGPCLLPFFCSEYDVDQIIKNGISAFIYEQMGYSYIWEIIKKLEKELEQASDNANHLVGAEETDRKRLEQDINDLDELIKKYKQFWPVFLHFLLHISNEKDEKKLKATVASLRKFLSTTFVLEESDEESGVITLLNDSNLKKERRAVVKAFGKDAELQSFVKQYDVMIGFVTNRTADKAVPDVSELVLKGKKNGSAQELKLLSEFNETRHFFYSQVLERIELGFPIDVASTMMKYNEIIKDAEYKMDQKRIQVEIIDKVGVFLRKKDVYWESLNALKTYVYGCVKQLTQGSRQLVQTIMCRFCMEGEETFFDYDVKQGLFSVIIRHLRDDNIMVDFPPEKYLNTFRYRLYCMTLKIAIAMAMMDFYKFNFPVLMDDVFHSSDFSHRIMVRDFFIRIIKAYQEWFGKNDLQIILFSHDEVVVKAAKRGFCDMMDGSMVNFKMMFDYREADSPSHISLPCEKDVNSMGDNEINMINLAYE